MDGAFHRAIAEHMEGIFREAFRGMLLEWETPGFPWEAVQQSFDAFEDIIAKVYNVPVQKLLPDVRFQENSQPSLRLLMPILQALWLDQGDKYQEGEFQAMAMVFYDALGAHLNRIASETTGDTEQEKMRFRSIISELAGRIGGKYSLVDVGTGGGERILRPVLESLIQQERAPSRVLGVDLLSFPPPDDDLWTPLVADFSSPEFVGTIEELDPDAVHRIVMSSWSPLADVDTLDREAAFANFSKLAEWAVIDMPSPDNYGSDQLESSGIGGGGRINRAFPGPDGQGDVKKPFSLPGITELVAQAQLAGYEWVNPIGTDFAGVPTEYRTKNNNYQRFTLVFRRVGEPQKSVARMLFGSSASGPRRLTQRRS